MDTDRLLKLRDVVDLTRMGKSTIYRKISAGLFPKPVGLGGKSVRWRESDITRWIASLS